MRESGSKRSASSSPSRDTKKRRDNNRDDEFSDNSNESAEDETTVQKSDDSGSKNYKKKKVSADKSEEKSKRKKDERKQKKRRRSMDKTETEEPKKYSDASSPEHVETERESPTITMPPAASRYWGGEPEKAGLEDGEISSHSQDADYEVGRRYYDAKPENKGHDKEVKEDYVGKRYYEANPEKAEETEKEVDSDFVVGKRYYEDKPEAPGEDGASKKVEPATAPTRRAKLDDPLLSRTGGAYIPPAKLRLMQASITDKSSISYQRIAWEALKKSIHGHINKVNTSNIGIIARLLMKENIVRGRGLLCRSLLQAQAASTTFTNVYACLVSVINSKFPNVGELLMKRVILQFKRGFKRNDKALCIASCQFIAHLVNQQVAHEILALEMLTLLLESPTDDSVEVAVAFLKEVGQKLLELSPKGTNAIFDMLRNILHQGNLEKRVQYMIEVVFQVRKDGFRSFESVDENLDLVEEEDRYTHILTLDEAVDPEDLLNVFKHDPDYEVNEDKYKALKEEIIGGSSSEEESGDEGSDEDSDEEGSEEEEQGEAKESKSVTIIDETETNLVALRRTIYLTIQSSLDFEECCHKLLKMDIKPGQEPELCHMLLDCCAELRTYEKFFGLLAQRFCQINRVYIAPLEEMFAGSYATVHRLDTNKLRNIARFFGHLLFTDAISWQVLESVRLNEEDTTSSSRIFIKILFQELAEYMGLALLNHRLKDPTLQTAMEGLFPRDNPKNTRFAINFFTSIGLGGLTDDLREHLKTQPKPSAVAQLVDKLDISSDSSTSSSSDSSDESSDSESSSESSSDSGIEKKNNNKKNKDKVKISKEKKKDREELGSRGKPSGKEKISREEKDLKYTNKSTNSNVEVLKKKSFEDSKRKENERDKKNSDRYRNEDKDSVRRREKCKKNRDKDPSLSKDTSRDKEKYEERESDRKHNKSRDFKSRNEKPGKDTLKQDYNRYEDKRKTSRDDTTSKSKESREINDAARDKENRKKDHSRDQGRERCRKEDKYREERNKRYVDNDVSRNNKERARERDNSRYHRDKSSRRQRS